MIHAEISPKSAPEAAPEIDDILIGRLPPEPFVSLPEGFGDDVPSCDRGKLKSAALGAPLPPLTAEDVDVRAARTLIGNVIYSYVQDATLGSGYGLGTVLSKLRHVAQTRRQLIDFARNPESRRSDLGLWLDLINVEREAFAMSIRKMRKRGWPPIVPPRDPLYLARYVSEDGTFYGCPKPHNTTTQAALVA